MLQVDKVYRGSVLQAVVRTAYNDEDNLDIHFKISTEDGVVKAKHQCYGDQLDRTKEVVLGFGIAWPELERIQEAVGQECDVWIGEYEGTVYGKINVGTPPEDAAKVKKALDRLKARELGGEDAEPEDVPF